MKQRVVFLFYHGFGHLTAIFKLARILEGAGYDVYFAGAAYFQDFVLTNGFKFYILKSNPFGYGFEKWTNTIEKSRHIYLSTVHDRITDRLYKKREVEFFWMLEALKPSVIFIDSRQATDFIILYARLRQKSIRMAIIQAMLPMDVTPGHPPINTGAFPHDRTAVRQAIRSMRIRQFLRDCKKKLIYFGHDDHHIIKRRLKKNNIPDYYIFRTLSLVNFSLKNVDELIITPREFDFPEFTPTPSQHFVGFMTNEIRNEALEPDYEKISGNIFKLREGKNLKLIYCSFGTVEPKKKSTISLFLEKLIRISRTENYILIISLKAKHANLGNLKSTGNVYIFNSVPQLDVLRYTDVFITHGGINSIKEAIYAEVPMLLYPVHSEYDPIGNAARIAYHRLGLRGKIDTDTEEDIDAKLKELLQNPLYKNNVQEFKEKDTCYTPEKFLEIFNTLKRLEF
jgi:zeaxanthin glucosyltransferase